MAQYTNDPNVGNGYGSADDRSEAQSPPIIDQARDVAAQVTTEAKDLVSTTFARRQEQSAMELTSLANVLRDKSEEMEHSLFAPIVGKAADQMDRASDYLKDANVKDVVRSTESLARREPLLFLGGAFTLGLVCARFLRSSAHRSEDASEPAPVRG